MTTTCQRCGYTNIPVRKSFSVSGSIPVPDQCPGCGEDLQTVGGLAKDAEPDRESRLEQIRRRLMG